MELRHVLVLERWKGLKRRLGVIHRRPRRRRRLWVHHLPLLLWAHPLRRVRWRLFRVERGVGARRAQSHLAVEVRRRQGRRGRMRRPVVYMMLTVRGDVGGRREGVRGRRRR